MRHKTILAPVVGIVIAVAFSGRAQTNVQAPNSKNATKTLAARLGYAPDAKLLIVHADDLGAAHSIDAASIKAFESGLVNSGSIMIPCPWLSEIATYARSHPDADLGLHLTLTSEWTPYRWGPVLSKDRVASLLDGSGYFYLTETEAASHMDPKEVEAELRSQIERARSVGIHPTHLDSHMGTLYQNKALFEILLRLARENKLPTRMSREFLEQMSFLPSLLTPDDIIIDRIITMEPEVSPDNWAKFYEDAIKTIQPGITEMVVHIAYDDGEMRGMTFDHPNWGAAWRQRDFDFLTSDRFRSLLKENNIKLVTWREVGKLIEKKQ
ncbi:MAG TPA: polysaccharide deacetylase family protein [Pyrinomonadaceae bacterium]|nr:polysaccharide deacetylase family protein [Pyrinomonadaceae bacterium]